MLESEEKEITTENLLSMPKRSLVFSNLLTDSKVKFEISKFDALKDIGDAKSLFDIEKRRDNPIEENIYRQTEKSLETFIKKNSELAGDTRFCDTYNYRVSTFYKLLGDFPKEREYLFKITDKENEFYSQKINENLLRTENTEQDALKFLESTDTEEATIYVAAFYKKKGEYEKAKNHLLSFYEKHGPTFQVNNMIAADCIIRTFEYERAVSYLKESFFHCRYNSDTALMLSVLYRILSIKNRRLTEKSKRWAKTAFSLDSSSEYALTMIAKLFIDENPVYTESAIEKYLKRPSSKEKHFYERALLLKGKCRYTNKKYSDCISVLQEMTGSERYKHAAWNNLALCNMAIGKSDLALKNIERAVKIIKETNDEMAKEKIYPNYLNILTENSKYKEACDFVESEAGGIENLIPKTRSQYLDIISPYIKSLFSLGRLEESLVLLTRIFSNAEDYLVKNCAAIDIIRFCLITDNFQTEICEMTKDALVANYEADTSLFQNLNDIVFACLEMNAEIPRDILNVFLNNVSRNEFFLATYGLYQFKIKNDCERGVEYYSKAMSRTKDDFIYEELKIKCRTELAKFYLKNGETKKAQIEAHGIIKKCPPRLFWYANEAQKILKEKF